MCPRALLRCSVAVAVLACVGMFAACSGAQPETRAVGPTSPSTVAADPLDVRCPPAPASAPASALSTPIAVSAASRPRQVIQGRHTRGVTQLAFSPDGKLLASASLDRSVRVWDAARRDELRVIHRPTRDVSLAVGWNDAGSTLVVSGFRELSSLIDVATGNDVRALDPPLPRVFQRIDAALDYRWLGRTPEGLTLLGESRPPILLPAPPGPPGGSKIGDFSASRDGGAILATSTSNARSLFVWSRREGGGFDVRSVPIEDIARVGAIALLPAGDAAIVEVERADRRFDLLLVSIANGAGAPRPIPIPPEIQAKGVHRLAVSSDGSLLAATSENLVAAWDLAAMRLRFQRTLEGARAPQSSARWEGSPVAISPDGRWIVAGTFTGTISLYAAATGRYRGSYGASAAVRAARDVVFTGADSIAVLSADHITRWSIPEARVVGAERAGGVVRLEQSAAFGAVKVKLIDPAADPACGPGGQRVVFDGQTDLPPACVAARPPGSGVSSFLDVSLPAKRAIAVRSLTDGPALIDLTTGTAIPLVRDGRRSVPEPPRTKSAAPEAPCSSPTNAALSADGRLAAATGSPDGNTCVWDATTGERLLVMKVDPSSSRRGFSNRAAFSPDGRTLAIGRDNRIVLTKLPGGAIASDISVGPRVLAMEFAEGGSALLAGGDDGSLMTLRGGAVIARGQSDGGAVRAIRVDPSGLRAATVSDDGAVRLWDVRSASLRGSFASFDDDEWIAATPGGAYAGTLEVGERIGWVFDEPVERFGFERFAEAFLAPDIVRRRAAGEDIDTSVEARRPPRLELAEAAEAKLAPSAFAVLHAHTSSHGRVESVRVFSGGRAVAAAPVCAREGKVELRVPLDPGLNRLTVVAFDDQGFASNEVTIDAEGASAAAAKAPDVWVVAVGVSSYPALAPAFQLGVADDDAVAVAAAFKAMEGGAYAKAHAVTLTDAEATPPAIRRAIAGLGSMKPTDLAVVFFAGHGIKLDAASDMMFLTGGPADPANPARTRLTADLARRDGIGWKEIREALGAARGRVLVMLDACHSGHLTQEVVAPNEALAGALARGERASVLVLAASKGRQLSLEPATSRGFELEDAEKPAVRFDAAEPHGFFTGALLAALADPKTDRDESGTLEASELIDEVKGRVTRLTRGAQTPWVAKRDLFGDFTLARSKARR